MDYIYYKEKRSIVLKEYIGKDKIVNVPEFIEGKRVKRIDSLCFFLNENIEEIHINNIKEIKNNAIVDCCNLKIIELTNVTKVGNIFEDCDSNIKIITSNLRNKKLEGLSEQVYIKDDVLYEIEIISEEKKEAIIKNCRKFYENMKIPDFIKGYKIVEIDNVVFKENKVIKKVELPLYLHKINPYQFHLCENLEEVIIKENCIGFGTYAFSFTNIKELKCPPNLQYINSYCFNECKITEFICNDTIQKIGEFAFYYSNLVFFQFPSTFTTLEQGILKGTNIEYIEIPSWMETIPVSTFESSKLSEIKTSCKNHILGDKCFYSCKNLYLTASFIYNLNEIGEYCFSDVNIAKEIIINKNTKLSKNSFYRAKGVNKVRIENNFNSNIIPHSCFSYSSLVEIYLPKQITIIDDFAFSHSCLEKINSKYITEIKSYAFKNSLLKEFKFTNNLKELGNFSFLNCIYLNKISFSKDCKITEIGQGCFDSSNISGTLSLPNNIEIINSSAFRKTKINKIIFNDKLKTIYANAFKFTKIRKLKFPSTLESLGYEAFSNCLELESIEFNGNLKCIGNHCFSQDIMLSKLINFDKIKIDKIPYYCFYKTKINDISLPETVADIEEYAFYNCENLRFFKCSKNLQNIGRHSFSYCNFSKGFVWNEVDLTINTNAFFMTVFPETFEIPQNIKTIYERAFNQCSGIKKLYLNISKNTTLKLYNFEFEDLECIYIKDNILKTRFKNKKFFKDKPSIQILKP